MYLCLAGGVRGWQHVLAAFRRRPGAPPSLRKDHRETSLHRARENVGGSLLGDRRFNRRGDRYCKRLEPASREGQIVFDEHALFRRVEHLEWERHRRRRQRRRRPLRFVENQLRHGGQASDASGVYGSSDNGYGVFGSTGSSSGYGVVSQGNELVEGEIYTSGSCKSGCSKTRGQASFGTRASEPDIEDSGEAVLRNGVARVALNADFVNTIDSSKAYVVLLTPEGDASMYVAGRTPAGFEVREVGGSHGSAPFAYRIIAKPFGVRDERLPFKSVVDASTLGRRGAP